MLGCRSLVTVCFRRARETRCVPSSRRPRAANSGRARPSWHSSLTPIAYITCQLAGELETLAVALRDDAQPLPNVVASLRRVLRRLHGHGRASDAMHQYYGITVDSGFVDADGAGGAPESTVPAPLPLPAGLDAATGAQETNSLTDALQFISELAQSGPTSGRAAIRAAAQVRHAAAPKHRRASHTAPAARHLKCFRLLWWRQGSSFANTVSSPPNNYCNPSSSTKRSPRTATPCAPR